MKVGRGHATEYIYCDAEPYFVVILRKCEPAVKLYTFTNVVLLPLDQTCSSSGHSWSKTCSPELSRRCHQCLNVINYARRSHLHQDPHHSVLHIQLNLDQICGVIAVTNAPGDATVVSYRRTVPSSSTELAHFHSYISRKGNRLQFPRSERTELLIIEPSKHDKLESVSIFDRGYRGDHK